ncbi:S8 family peptidase, partial [Methylobacterium sp. yr668]|uniref:S8 family peptidase n=1 Tax=Methylobacterium sp. yr668 TaxID=1761801 RepID=UPI001FCDDBE0
MGLLIGASLGVLALALGPVVGQSLPARSPSTAGLTAADFIRMPEYRADWGLAKIDAATAYARGFTGLGVLVAVVDSGIDPTHPEFIGRISPASRNFIPGETRLRDTDLPTADDPIGGHGTHVSGTVAASFDGRGMMGVAFDSTILAAVDLRYVNEATRYAADRGARVLNGSFGDDFRYERTSYQTYTLSGAQAEYDAMKYAAAKGVLMVRAAGNEHTIYNQASYKNPINGGLFPYVSPENANAGVYRFVDNAGNPVDQSQIRFSGLDGYVVSVVALDSNNNVADFSNLCGVAKNWCMSAPGVDIYSTLRMGSGENPNDPNYGLKSGTSMAAPHVAGAAAVLFQAFPFLTAPQIAQTMFTTATHLGDGPANAPNATFGWGLLNLGKAIDGPGQLTSDWTVNTTYNGQAYYGRFANAISGVGGLTKVGLGTLELAGTNTYAGPTTVAGGTLFLSASGSLTSPVSVQSAGTYLNAGWTQSSVSNAGLLINTGTISGGATNAGTALSSGVIAGGVANSGTLSNSGTVAGGLTNTGTALNTGTIGGGATNSGSLINAGTLAGGLTNTGTALNTGAIAGGVISSGILSNSGAIGGGVANTGLLATSGTISGGLTNAGTVLASAGRIDGPIANNAGLLAVAGSLAGTGPFANAAGATLAVTTGGSYSLAGPLANAGLVAVAQSASLTASGGLSNAGL